ncbi:ABC transporter substrate-binding protein [Acidocella facilis]|uniref:ABC transporter substrate-binding protein n=1 Tax=Acidocella facilis TaxID=525 RepID=UPI001F485C56|nr:ABC transporter substrate-binding protein [Acidocella facilis]
MTTKLKLSIATGNYDRTRPLVDGDVAIDGVDPIFMLLSPEEMFFRSFRDQAFDVSELSLSSFAVKTADGNNPYVGVPVFPSRAFRHTAITIRTDRGINAPEDLRGRRIGTPEYQLTACVWARALLQEEYGVAPSDVIWVRGGLEELGRPEKISIKLPSNIKIEPAPADKTLAQMLKDGDIDAIVAPRAPSCFEQGDPNIGWLWPNPQDAASDYFKKTKIFPIMHMIGIRKKLADEHPWLPVAIAKAFSHSKKRALELLVDTSATKVTLPFVDELLRSARQLMGDDFWPYGIEPNRYVLDRFLAYHHEQGLSSRQLTADELFHPSTLATFKI